MKTRKCHALSILLPALAALTMGGSFVQGALSADQILARADAIRFPPGDHRVEATITFLRSGKASESGEYKVFTKGNTKTLIETLAPATERGNSILMMDRDLWIFVRDVSQPVRISFQQRLLGDVANGDLARANFVGDYTPSIVKQNDRYYVLNLAAKGDDVTYNRVLLEVAKGSFRPVKAQFFAASGKLLKTGSYQNYRPLAGALRPTRLVFDNPFAKGQRSVITFTQMLTEDLPDKYFTKDYLKKLKY